jgi:hypothetical protein
MSTYTDLNGEKLAERRQSPDLRALFDGVVHRVEPFFQEGGNLNGSRADFWVVRAISDSYPELSNEEAHILAAAARRYFQERAGH